MKVFIFSPQMKAFYHLSCFFYAFACVIITFLIYMALQIPISSGETDIGLSARTVHDPGACGDFIKSESLKEFNENSIQGSTSDGQITELKIPNFRYLQETGKNSKYLMRTGEIGLGLYKRCISRVKTDNAICQKTRRNKYKGENHETMQEVCEFQASKKVAECISLEMEEDKCSMEAGWVLETCKLLKGDDECCEDRAQEIYYGCQ